MPLAGLKKHSGPAYDRPPSRASGSAQDGGKGKEAKRAAAALPSGATRARSKPAVRRFARAGIASRGVIYVVLAAMAVDIAVSRRAPADVNGHGALVDVGRQPGGRALLGLLGVGMAGYACWRALQALSRSSSVGGASSERLPTGLWSPKKRKKESQRTQQRAVEAGSWVERVGFLASAAIYVGLCWQAFDLMVGSSGNGTSGGGVSSHPQPLVGSVLRWPGGPGWVALGAVAVGGGGVALGVWGCFHDYSRVFGSRRRHGAVLTAARATGIAGEMARGSMLVLVSVYLLGAAVSDNPSRAKGLGSALGAFVRLPAGPPLLGLAAAGLLCFAGYSAIEALYRDI